jgi:hypothetical protein
MRGLARTIEHRLDVPVQRLHDADPRTYQRPATFCRQDQRALAIRHSARFANDRRTESAVFPHFLFECLRHVLPETAE